MALKLQTLSSILSVAILLGLITDVSSQIGSVEGKVINSTQQAISNADVYLVSSLGENSLLVHEKSNSEGKFRISFSWDNINGANNIGATWKIVVKKDGYATKPRNILIAMNRVDPEFLTFVLLSNKYDEMLPDLDKCADINPEIKTLYLFDLIASNISSGTFKGFLNILCHKLKYGVTNYLESYKLLGNEKIDIRRCDGLPVEIQDVAVSFGCRLNAPGVIWGYIEESGAELKTIITFTSLFDTSITGLSPISYSRDIFKLLQPNLTVDKAYLAFSCFIIGNLHLNKGDIILARRCFNQAKELNALPTEFDEKLDQIIARLDQNNVAKALYSINRGH
jgi:tetratricopeptide (TPR) repeat protein